VDPVLIDDARPPAPPGRRFSAAEALESGLLARVTAADELLPSAREIAAQRSPLYAGR
jgi:enoyl-CoA hydratase/carnithine racemase